MKNLKPLFVAATLASLAVGCGNESGGSQVSANRNESGENSNFGSATDIRGPDQVSSTNSLNEADNGLGGPVQRESGNYQSQPAQGQASDEELAKKVKVALTTGSMGTTGVLAENQLTPIDVKVQNGEVTLRGPVSSDQEKQTIQKQVEGMKGVRSVRNELTVGGRTVSDQATDPIVPRPPQNR
jgi:hypothetical protein